jgi:hypothetical protein
MYWNKTKKFIAPINKRGSSWKRSFIRLYSSSFCRDLALIVNNSMLIQTVDFKDSDVIMTDIENELSLILIFQSFCSPFFTEK